ncbi:unnamed protein product [Phyllotreta striolata]|uniref:Transmembrane protein 267 n=1 Tax=Phyllotreta striolata TaxID=444603 RepID=A0A9N9XJC9_PHYSR|nr:unnamed protein product [Phyllotreta striolata]
MYLFQIFNNSSSYSTLLIVVTAIVGDYVVAYSKLHVFQALFDNATHFTIGGLCWFIVCLHSNSRGVGSTRKIVEIACCSLLSSLIDVDHFVEAKSISLKNATNLKRRPFLHCSTIPILLCSILLLISYASDNGTMKRVSLIIWTAFASHHTRDATRRGYWFYPFGSSPAIPYAFYIALTCILPYSVVFLDRYISISSHYDALDTIII